MWEKLSNLELYEEWLAVWFNYDHNDPMVAKTLARLEEALTKRREDAIVKEDAVLPDR